MIICFFFLSWWNETSFCFCPFGLEFVEVPRDSGKTHNIFVKHMEVEHIWCVVWTSKFLWEKHTHICETCVIYDIAELVHEFVNHKCFMNGIIQMSSNTTDYLMVSLKWFQVKWNSFVWFLKNNNQSWLEKTCVTR